MKAITTRFYGPTARKPSRVIARTEGHNFTVTASQFDDPHLAAAITLARKLDWAPVSLIRGTTANGDQVFVIVDRQPVYALHGDGSYSVRHTDEQVGRAA